MSHGWVDVDRSAVSRRYDRLALLIPLFDWLLFLPRGFRRKAVGSLGLRPGDRVLEIGCGTGRNFRYLRDAVGASGHIYGVDISAGMLDVARKLCVRHGWDNVHLVKEDAGNFAAPVPLDGVLFGLSYNTISDHRAVLRRHWAELRAGGRLVIMDAKVPPSARRLLLPFGLWLMRRTLLGNPYVRPWKDLAKLAGKIDMEEFLFGAYYICGAVKP